MKNEYLLPGAKFALAGLFQQIAELADVLGIDITDSEIADTVCHPGLSCKSHSPDRQGFVSECGGFSVVRKHEYGDAMLAHTEDQLCNRCLLKIRKSATDKRELG